MRRARNTFEERADRLEGQLRSNVDNVRWLRGQALETWKLTRESAELVAGTFQKAFGTKAGGGRRSRREPSRAKSRTA